MMDTVAATVRRATRVLAAHSESPRLDAELLLCRLLRSTRAGLVVRAEETVAESTGREFDGLLAQRVAGVPVAYLLGTREFWSLPFDVTPDVLVPRPETELLVEAALELLPPRCAHAVVDLGTGSGAIALAVASERPQARVTGVDLSAAALAVAAGNARKFDLPRVRWRQGSWYQPLAGERFDLILANPPYVAAGDPALARLSAEPALALSPGPTGFEDLRTIIEGAARHLLPGGSLLLEHDRLQAPAVDALLRRLGFEDVRSRADYAGVPRITIATVHFSI